MQNIRQKKSPLLICLISIFVLSFCILFTFSNTADVYAKSEGNDLIYIESALDLFKLSDSNNIGKTFKLKNNIDLNLDTSWHAKVTDNQNGWLPIDTINQIGCSFDGGGFTISNLFIDRPYSEYVGLFSRNSINIENLFIATQDSSEEYFIKNSDNAGILASENYGSIKNVHATGSVNADNYVGGLIAKNYGSIDNCSFVGRVDGEIVGGLIGVNESKIVSNCLVRTIAKGHIVGGLIGQLNSDFTGSIVTACFADATIIENRKDDGPVRLGALIGIREHGIIINNCYSNDLRSVIAFGNYDGAEALNVVDITKQISFLKLDFNNYWAWSDESNQLIQRTIAVVSNTIDFNGIITSIKGDRKYYVSNEQAVLTFEDNGKKNVDVLSLSINGEEVAYIDGKSIVEINKQLNVNFLSQYLIFVKIRMPNVQGEVRLNKEFYASGESIEIEIILDKHTILDSITSNYNNSIISFEKYEGKYRGHIPSVTFQNDSILYITANIQLIPQLNFEIVLWILFGSFSLFLALVLVVLIKKRSKMINQPIRKQYLKSLTYKITIIFLTILIISCLALWVILILESFYVVGRNVFLLMLPIIILETTIIVWCLFNKYSCINESLKNASESKHLHFDETLIPQKNQEDDVEKKNTT